MNRVLAVATVLALPMAVSACTSSSTPSAHNSPSSAVVPSSTPTSSPTPVSTGDDKQRAGAIQLTVGDLPSGWKSNRITTTAAQQRQEDTYFDACLGVPTIETEQTTSSAVEFGRSDGLAFADGLINVTKTADEAQADWNAFIGPKGVDCAVADAKKFLKPPKGASIVSITGSRLAVPNGQFGVRTVVTLKLSNGREVTLTSDDIGMIAKRFEIQVTFTGVVQPVQKALEDSVAAKVFARAAANAA